MGLAEIQALKKLDKEQVYKGIEPTEDEKALSKLDDVFYQEIWSASPHVCQCGCGTKLTSPWKRSYFHHLLPKQSYPAFRHVPENVILLTPNCHDKAEKKIKSMPLIEKRLQEVTKLLLK